MSAKRGWMSLTLLVGAVLGFWCMGGTAAPAEKAKHKAVAGENVYYEPMGIDASVYVNGKPIEIRAELNRLVTTRFSKKYPRGAAHLHPWRKRWDKVLEGLDTLRQPTVLVLQSDSFLATVTNTTSLCTRSGHGKWKSSEPTWVIAYLGYALGTRPIRLKSVTVSGRQIRFQYTRIRLDPRLPFIPPAEFATLGGDAVVIVNCGKLKPGDYEIKLVDSSSRKPELTRTFSVAK
jgi:hypothetical protein